MTGNILAGLTNPRILVAVFIGTVLAPTIIAQAPRQLKVEFGPNQQIRILANDVSYGEVLRVLQGKLGWDIEIPRLADELKLSDILVEANRPQDALAKLLDGSRLGYAFVGAANGSHILKVIVIPTTPLEGTVTQDASLTSPIPDNENTVHPDETVVSTPERPQAPSTMSLSDATKAIGVPPSGSPADVGQMKTFPISDAAKTMGVPPGVSPADVGQMMTLSISEAAKIIGVPPGMLPSDVGKTITLPLPTGPSQRP